MSHSLKIRLSKKLEQALESGNLKEFRTLLGPIGREITIEGTGPTLLFASNDYLGLANRPEVVRAGQEAMDKYGAGTASARFICGTSAPHHELEDALAAFLHTPAAVTFTSCWAANTGLIPAITEPGDVIISDANNHASLIDGMRMAPKDTQRHVFPHSDMKALEDLLRASRDAPARFIVTDGVFSMEGDLARLDDIVRLARAYDAIVILDDAHGIGTVGATGRGVAEFHDLLGAVDIITGSLGKALGGAAGGFVAGPREVIDALMQFARPHLFSTALPVSVVCSTLAALRILDGSPAMVEELAAKATYFRDGLVSRGLSPIPGHSAIVPVIIGETAKAVAMSRMLLADGLFVIGFGYPVVAEGAARLRFQISYAHSWADLDTAIERIGAAHQRVCASTEGNHP